MSKRIGDARILERASNHTGNLGSSQGFYPPMSFVVRSLLVPEHTESVSHWGFTTSKTGEARYISLHQTEFLAGDWPTSPRVLIFRLTVAVFVVDVDRRRHFWPQNRSKITAETTILYNVYKISSIPKHFPSISSKVHFLSQARVCWPGVRSRAVG